MINEQQSPQILFATKDYELKVCVFSEETQEPTFVYSLVNTTTGVIEYQDSLFMRIHPLVKQLQEYWDSYEKEISKVVKFNPKVVS